jgi:hypothetical protein
MRPRPNLNGLAIERTETTIYVPLPPEAWRSAGSCQCSFCEAHPELEPSWDTIAIAVTPTYGTDTTWTVHRPEDNPYAIALTREIP